MSETLTIGTLQARLTADSAQFESGTRKGKQALDALVLGMAAAGKQATDSGRLINGMSQAGRELADAAERAKRPLDALALGMSMAGKEATSSGKLIAGMSQAGRTELERLSEAAKKAGSAMSLTDQAAGLLKSTFAQFTAANLAATAISGITAKVGEFIATGAKLPAVEASFQRLTTSAGQGTRDMLAAMTDATRGMVANYDLMLSANKAMLLGLPVTVESMGDLARSATALGKAMGLDATTALNDLITALGRSSPLILDNLGLTVKVGDANEAYAAKLGTTVGQMTEAEKKMAFYEAAMEAARKKTKELGDQTKTLGEIMQTAWTSVGNVVAGVTADINKGVGNALSSAKNLANFMHDWMQFGVGIAMVNAKVRDEITNAKRRTEDIELAPEKTVDALDEYWQRLATIAAKSTEVSDAQRRMIVWGNELGQTTSEIATALGLEEAAVDATIAAHDKATEAAKKHGAELEKLTAAARKLSDSQFGVNSAAGQHAQSGLNAIASSLFSVGAHRGSGALVNPDPLKGIGDFKSGQLRSVLGDPWNALRGDKGVSGASLAPQPGGSFLGTVSGGIGTQLQNMWKGMSGGGGVAGLFTNIGGGLLTGGLNSLMNLAVGGVGKLVGKLFGKSEGAKTNDLRDSKVTEFTGIGNLRGAQDELRKLAAEAGIADTEVRRLFDTKKQKDFEAAFASVTSKIKSFTDEQTADQERLTQALEKYGFAFEDIGQKLQGKQLADQAKELIQDWRVLGEAGIDLATVNSKMADSINAFLQTALAVGAEVPSAMRPILQSLVDQGQLFDASGNKIEDLQSAGITFAETLTQGFDRVIAKLDEFLTRLGMAGSAMASLPSPEVSVPAFMPPNAEDFAYPMAEGGAGRVHGPTLFLAGEKPGGEDFAFSGAGKRFGGGGSDQLTRQLIRTLRDLPRRNAQQLKAALAGV